jgi:hypothetical protein
MAEGIEFRCPYCERTVDFDLYVRHVANEWLKPQGIKSEAGALSWIFGQMDRLGEALAVERLRVKELEVASGTGKNPTPRETE